ncbi:MAG: hypothetical protein LAN36_15470 [Acidobacteriia bacterium]|nr:hypothetical protein [Terriglobia bacterium]
MDSNQPSTQRRRSERISKSVPLIVRGIDLLGQPFEERTSTLALNLHGCRYSSKHHLPKNTWVTIELPQGASRRNLRARVAWIQRPHSVREFFQIAVELESPANIWNLESPPADWESGAAGMREPADFSTPQEPRIAEESEPSVVSEATDTSTERTTAHMTNAFSESASSAASTLGQESAPAESPLLREWSAEIERQASRAAETAAAKAAEHIRHTIEEFERVHGGALGVFSTEVAAKQEALINRLQAEFESGLRHARELLHELDGGTQALRAENDAALESTSRVAQARLQLEAAQAARAQLQSAEASRETTAFTESATASWKQRLESEMALAQSQWNELLQSSLDSSIERLVEQLSGRSQDVLRGAEQRMSERLAELRQPVGQLHAEARESLAGVKSALEQEVARARSSLAEIEHAASRMKEYSAQLEAASHDTLNELHRRLENILDAQTDELSRRAENLAAGVPQRLAPTLDSLGQQFVERTMAEVETKLAPRIERVPELLRELAAREVEAEESLRLQRERLRQVSENNQREAASQMAATLTSLRNDFEFARKEALAKWNEELDASGVRASHAAAESIGRSSEWFQQEARARLQVLVEQTMTTAGNSFDERASLAVTKFDARLEEQSTGRLAQIEQQLDGLAAEVAGRTRTRLDEAAEAAAASFGQVLRSISEQEGQQFATRSRGALEERQRELEGFAEQLLRNIEANSGALVERFQAQMASQIQANVAEGRSALAAECASALEGYRAERELQHKEWAASLERANEAAVVRYQDRLETASDSWMVSSVRRLNEHGQNVIESLMRSADQALRDSCSKVFEGLSEMLRDRTTNAAGTVGFTPAPAREAGETPAPHNQSASNSANA